MTWRQINRVHAASCRPASAGAHSVNARIRAVLLVGLLAAVSGGLINTMPLAAQAPATAAPAAGSGSQRGTVKAIEGSKLTLTTDAGKQVMVNVGETAKILQIAPGSTDLKTAQTIQLTDIAAGDRVLVTGKAGDSADSVAASRVILMKSTDIAQKHAAEQADWNRRGSGGIVSAVDASAGTITVSNGAKKTQIATTDKTIFRRYAGDSVKFEDAQPGTLGQIQPGDQVRVRGTKSEDGTSLQAEEVVSGSFRNLAGTVVSTTTDSVTLKDLATKKNVMVKVTANSDFRKLPPQAAAMFAARAKGGAGSPGAAGASGASADGGQHPAGAPSSGTGGGTASADASQGRRGAGTGYGGGQGAGGRGGMDLAQMISRLPEGTLPELKAGDALMIVASQTGGAVTAITMLSGVEPILAASPAGAAPAITLSPFGFGGGAPEMGGSQ